MKYLFSDRAKISYEDDVYVKFISFSGDTSLHTTPHRIVADSKTILSFLLNSHVFKFSKITRLSGPYVYLRSSPKVISTLRAIQSNGHIFRAASQEFLKVVENRRNEARRSFLLLSNPLSNTGLVRRRTTSLQIKDSHRWRYKREWTQVTPRLERCA